MAALNLNDSVRVSAPDEPIVMGHVMQLSHDAVDPNSPCGALRRGTGMDGVVVVKTLTSQFAVHEKFCEVVPDSTRRWRR